MKYFINAFIFMIYFFIFSSYKCKKLYKYKFYINKKIVYFKSFMGLGPGMELDYSTGIGMEIDFDTRSYTGPNLNIIVPTHTLPMIIDN